MADEGCTTAAITFARNHVMNSHSYRQGVMECLLICCHLAAQDEASSTTATRTIHRHHVIITRRDVQGVLWCLLICCHMAAHDKAGSLLQRLVYRETLHNEHAYTQGVAGSLLICCHLVAHDDADSATAAKPLKLGDVMITHRYVQGREGVLTDMLPLGGPR